ncbi:MAG TPA: hypothetical protein VFB72_12805 [Verrucomicrobiae bacterium]|nr:hypothetical protein [Verrucomicrobiae bacterium]
MHLLRVLSFALTLIVFLFTSAANAHPEQLGIFEGETDIGSPARAGSVEFDPAKQTYLVSGGGSNMWFGSDAFHFVWKKVSGDISLAADVSFIGTEGNAHRKACLIVRQSLAPDSPYADAALHGNGLISLQYRETNNAFTREIISDANAPARLRIEKRGEYVSMSIANAGEKLHPAGGSFRLRLDSPYYVGLGVCAHDNNSLCQAVFSNVTLGEEHPGTGKPTLLSALETVNIASKDRQVLYVTTNHIEAPNWSLDGTFLLFNGNGHLYRLAAKGGKPTMLDTGFANRCNNDHGISPDGTQLAISDQSQEKHSLIYILPIGGGTPKRITTLGPSYWHGWSPDGQTLVFCGERNKEFDVYSIPVAGGEEKRLTSAPGLDDGPEYSRDGKFIYFNSERSGSMQIWRMRPDGSQQEQVTSDDYNNWFPHMSPNGHWLVFLSYEKDVKGHPENKDVMLRIMPAAGGKIEVLAKLFGGQGTINVPSWAPDSSKLAFMSYEFLP